MIRKLLLIIFIILLSLTLASSEKNYSEAVRDFGVSLEINNYQVKEKVLNNIVHDGSSISGLGLFWEKYNNLWLKKIEIELGFPGLKSRYETENNSLAINTMVRYLRVWKVYSPATGIDIYFGGCGGLDSHIGYYENWDESHFYWLTSYYLAPSIVLKVKNSLFLELSVPFLALVSRPAKEILVKEIDPDFFAVLGLLHQDISLTSLNRHLAFNVETGFNLRLGRKVKSRLSWRFRYVSNNMPGSAPFQNSSHTFGLSLIF